MPVVANGRRIEVGRPYQGTQPGSGGKTAIGLRVGKKTLQLKANRKARQAQVEANLVTVQECFGVSRSEALRLALHLTAESIRDGGMAIRVRV